MRSLHSCFESYVHPTQRLSFRGYQPVRDEIKCVLQTYFSNLITLSFRGTVSTGWHVLCTSPVVRVLFQRSTALELSKETAFLLLDC